MTAFRSLGVMSGSSLDGLDLALCTLRLANGRWSYTVEEATTVAYDRALQDRLGEAMQGNALELARLHRDLGVLIGDACRDFLAGRRVDVIASHGHTLFHQPDEGLTTQVGSGAVIAALTGMTTVCDFRTVDVALGGQGAPLVPLGERLLFPTHKAFLNLGGICNIALHGPDRITGYDVCIGNQALNALAGEAGLAMDRDGKLARSGQVMRGLLEALNALPFHHQPPPRSLGREWFEREVRPLLSDRSKSVADRSRTVVEHVAQQLAAALAFADGPVLVTGGGAHHGFLLERLRSLTATAVEVPDRATVDYKEALVFALLGILRLRGEVTSLASVTGARRDSVGGALYQPN